MAITETSRRSPRDDWPRDLADSFVQVQHELSTNPAGYDPSEAAFAAGIEAGMAAMGSSGVPIIHLIRRLVFDGLGPRRWERLPRETDRG